VAGVALAAFVTALEIALNRHVAGDGGAETTASLFHAVNIADTVKLVLLAAAIAAATRLADDARVVRAWLRVLGYAVAPVLVIGGLAFVVDSGALGAVLAVVRRSVPTTPAGR
jgi:hypothetical protein